MKTVEAVVQENLESYNNRNIAAYMSSFSEDIELYAFQEAKPMIVGLYDFRMFYEKLFQDSPRLHSTVLKRIVFDNKVIDHERIEGRQGMTEAFEIVMIYEVKEEKIFRMTILRK